MSKVHQVNHAEQTKQKGNTRSKNTNKSRANTETNKTKKKTRTNKSYILH